MLGFSLPAPRDVFLKSELHWVQKSIYNAMPCMFLQEW